MMKFEIRKKGANDACLAGGAITAVLRPDATIDDKKPAKTNNEQPILISGLMRIPLLFTFIACSLLIGSAISCKERAVITEVPHWNTLAQYSDNKPLFLAAVGDKIFVGTSTDRSDYFSRLLLYDAATGTFIEKKAYPGEPVLGASYFVSTNKLYVGMGTGSRDDPAFSFHVIYFSDFYEYDPSADKWTLIEKPPVYVATGTTNLIHNGKGVALFGSYQGGSQNTYYNNGGFIYSPGVSWGTVNCRLFGTPGFPNSSPTPYEARFADQVIRSSGCGFAIDDQVYTGGGSPVRSKTYALSNEEINATEQVFWAFKVTNATDGKGLNVVLDRQLTPPSTEYSLAYSSQAFALKNVGYIINPKGDVITYTPTSNRWDKLKEAPDGLLLGTSTDDKAYFLSNKRLVEYNP